MKKELFGATALAALCLCLPAFAADMPVRYAKAPPQMVSPAYNWSGFYVGIHGGYTFGDDSNITTSGQAAGNIANVVGGARPALVGLDRDGFIAGGQVGYNWQFSPSWVFGVEADISYVDNRDNLNVVTLSLPNAAPPNAPLNNTFRSGMEYFGTVRGRIGYAWDRTMVYATGGLAYGDVENSATLFGAAGQIQFAGGGRRFETGYTVGGGIEHAFTPNLSFKAEYLYYDLGSNTVNVALVPGGGGGGTGYDTRFQNDGHIVRAGLNFKLGGGWMGGRY
jgi:outer membrane immunogenic protein